MEKTPTVDEIIEEHFGDKLGLFTRKDVEFIALETTKLHVQQALEEVSEKINVYDYSTNNDYSHLIDKNSILNAYPLENIK